MVMGVPRVLTAGAALFACATADQGVENTVVPGVCTAGLKCTTAAIAEPRGVCVIVAGANVCWDVCDATHLNTDYIVSTDPVKNNQIALEVKEARNGANPGIQCAASAVPGVTGVDNTNKPLDWCVPGSRCGSTGDRDNNVPSNRGMCVLSTDAGSYEGRECWDMCNKNHNADEYTVGTQKGSESLVNTVRDGNDYTRCPWHTNWTLIFGIIGACICCIGAIGAVLYVLRMRGRGKAKTRGGNFGQNNFDAYAVSQGGYDNLMEQNGGPPMMPEQYAAPPAEMQPLTQQTQVMEVMYPVQPVQAPMTTAYVAAPEMVSQAQPAYNLVPVASAPQVAQPTYTTNYYPQGGTFSSMPAQNPVMTTYAAPSAQTNPMMTWPGQGSVQLTPAQSYFPVQ